MKTITKVLICGTMLLQVAGCASKPSATVTADEIIVNANVLTEDASLPEAESFAIKDGKIIAVGNEEDVRKYEGETTVVKDLGGKMVTPNLIDAHTHAAVVGQTAWYTDFPADVYEKDTILSYVKSYTEEHPIEEYPFIYFEYYPSNLFDENGPRKEWLDEVVSDRPIQVEDFSDHACWVNSKFLELIGAEQLQPGDSGYDNFVRDENGELTGWILEGAWQEYIDTLYEAIDWFPPEECDEKLMSILTDDLKSWGVTGIMDAYLRQDEQVESASNLDKAGKLNMYFRQAVVLGDYSLLDETIAHIHELQEKYDTDRVKTDTLKIFYDGTNEIGTSALVDGTVQDPDDHGYLMMDLDETKDTIRRCNEEKIDVHFHLVGDLAFRQVCDATEQLLDELGKLDIQVEMCHCELVHPDDMERPGKLGIIVNWTPHWSGGYFGDSSLKYLGQERYDSMYNFNKILEAGGEVTFGSDVYSMYEENRANPYFGMQTAMTRVDIEYPLDEGMRSSEESKLSLENLLKGYTISAAKQLRIDDVTGSITVGKYANFNIYDVNLFEVDENEFKDVLPSSVVFEGNVISGSAY